MESIKIRQGSAKNIHIIKEPCGNIPGEGIFEFLDYFSVFDWGRFLDDPIAGKGASVAAVSRKYFELLEENGIKTHYRGMIDPVKMKVELVNIPEAGVNVAPGTKNYLLPIEIIFRVYTHPESSDLKKIREGKKSFWELGYEEMPKANEPLPRVKISYSTKLEAADRLLTKVEAMELSGLDEDEMMELEDLATQVCEIITRHSDESGLVHYDGKIEVAKDENGEFMVTDVAGTLDEDRFMMRLESGEQVDISKQFVRNWFVVNGWKIAVDEAKKIADIRGVSDWTTICVSPPRLPRHLNRLASEMYLADAQARTGQNIGQMLGVKVRPLKEVAQDIYKIQRHCD